MNVKTLKAIKKFQSSTQKLCNKYNCTASIIFDVKETIIAEPEGGKNEQESK